MLNIDNFGREDVKIRYKLRPVPPKARTASGEGSYAAHVLKRTASLASIVEQMAREGSKYSEAELIAIVTHLLNTVAYRLAKGESVNLGSMIHLKPAIRGTFETLDTPFDATKHEVVVSTSVGSRLRKVVQQTKLEHVKDEPLPKLKSVMLVGTANTKNATVSFMVQGTRLMAKPNRKPHEWFIQIGDQRTAITPIANDTKKAMFAVPTSILPIGTTFQLLLRVYKSPKKYAEIYYDKPLTVS